ncbi:MAG: archaeosortase/exosortase family protein [Candidatus Aenigmatarchaeota archaeon]|nr:MAG: archaeosortase/exosortase family protein [Candidatus Aenigmarchaeota archaeon]
MIDLSERQTRRLENSFYFLLKLSAMAIPFHLAIAYADLSWLQTFTAQNVHSALALFGVNAQLNGAVLRFDGFDVLVSRDSTGWKSAFFLAALIVAAKAKSAEKLLGIAVFVPLIYAINIVRVSVTSYSAFYGVETFYLFHDILWQAGMAAAVLALWFAWLKKKSILAGLARTRVSTFKTAVLKFLPHGSGSV